MQIRVSFHLVWALSLILLWGEQKASAVNPPLVDGDFVTEKLEGWDQSRLPCPGLGARLAAGQRKFNCVAKSVEIEKNGQRHLVLRALAQDPPAPIDDKKAEGGQRKYRSEIADPFRISHGGTAWYKFRIFIPSSFRPTENRSCVVAQFHDQWTGKDFPESKAATKAHHPPLAFRVENRDGVAKTKVSLDAIGKAFELDLPVDTWVTIVMEIKWSEVGSGAMQLWLKPDGGTLRKPIDYRGKTTYAPVQPVVGRVSYGHYFKVGPYCGEGAFHSDLELRFGAYERGAGGVPSIQVERLRAVDDAPSKVPASLFPAE